MDSLPLLLLILVIGLATLVKASDFFTDAAEKLGLAIGLPPFIVGVTIVSMGTSLPELLSSLFGIFQGAAEVVASNVIGSNIANICLVVGVAPRKVDVVRLSFGHTYRTVLRDNLGGKLQSDC